MAINWDFDASDVEERHFTLVPEGKHRTRVASREARVSQNGNEYIAYKFDVSGQNSKIFYNLTFLKNNKQMTNQKINDFCKSFGLPPSMESLMNCVGSVGGVQVRHKDEKAEVHYFLNKEQQEKLDPWVEPSNSSTGGNAVPPTGMFEVSDDDDLPF